MPLSHSPMVTAALKRLPSIVHAPTQTNEPLLGRALVESRFLITGSRDWDNEVAMKKLLTKLYSLNEEATLVHGGAKGADQMAETIWAELGGRVECHPAHWQRYGNRAGRIRNEYMVDLGADLCIAFIKNQSRGATHCAGYAEKKGIRTLRIEENDDDR